MVDRNEIHNRVCKSVGYVSVHGTVCIFCLGIAVGFLGGWAVNARPDMSGVALLVAIILAIGFRYPVRMWMSWLDAQPVDKIINAVMLDLQPEQPKKDKNSFDQNDFDDNVRVQLLKMVREAKKSGVKVTGEQFFTTVIKSIR